MDGNEQTSLLATVDVYQAGERTVQFQRPRKIQSGVKRVFKLSKSRSGKLIPRPLGKWHSK